jgi:hypothetical protein
LFICLPNEFKTPYIVELQHFHCGKFLIKNFIPSLHFDEVVSEIELFEICLKKIFESQETIAKVCLEKQIQLKEAPTPIIVYL